MYRMMFLNGPESPAEVARHLREVLEFLSVPFESRQPPEFEREELLGFHILMCTVCKGLEDLEQQIRDLIAANAASR